MTDRLHSLYHHEAAHAIIAKALGARVSLVSCKQPTGNFYNFYVRHKRMSPHADAIIGLAGTVAQNIYARTNPEAGDGIASDADLASVNDLTEYHTSDYKAAMVGVLTATTAKLVSKYWRAITKLADAIARYQVLTGKQVDEVFNRHKPVTVYY